jgi:plastocyanin
MKLKLLFASALSLAMFAQARANTQLITVQNYKFTPNDVTIMLGDTIQYVWLNGSHTTTSTTIPSGAATWDHIISSSNTTFTYVPTVLGIYNYKCTPHESMGHIGKFTVVNTLGVSDYEVAKSMFNIYPNPAQSEINITFSNNSAKISAVNVVSITGKTVIENADVNNTKKTLDVSTLANGLYFVRVIQEGKTYVRQFTIAR